MTEPTGKARSRGGTSRKRRCTQHLTLGMEPSKWHFGHFPQASNIDSGFHFFYCLCISLRDDSVPSLGGGGGALTDFPLFCDGLFFQP